MANFKIPTSGFIEFEQIPYLVEIFPSPIMQALKTVSHHVKDRNDLLRSSNQLKFHELFVPEKNIIEATIKGIKVKVSANDFMTWQLERASSETLLEVINKTDASVTEILDYEKEYKNNPDYDPENWLNIYNQEQRENGILYIDRLRTDASKLFYDEVARAILDKNYGMVQFLETEIDNNLVGLQKYENWERSLAIVSIGNFYPYIEDGSIMMMDDWRLREMFVRNYDEGDIK